MKLQTLEDLFLHELKDLYSAENQLVKALPKMAKAATNPELKAGFEEHLEQTKGHVRAAHEDRQAAWQRAHRAYMQSNGRLGRRGGGADR